MSNTVKLQSSDDQEFEVERSVAEMSVTIKNMLEGMRTSEAKSIPFLVQIDLRSILYIIS